MFTSALSVGRVLRRVSIQELVKIRKRRLRRWTTPRCDRGIALAGEGPRGIRFCTHDAPIIRSRQG
jgi:hypothetical protein